MGLPIIFPEVDGPGRLTEICSFRRSGISTERYDEVFNGIQNITSQFPISRQSLVGTMKDDESMSTLIVDWTSAEEKDVFEPGERYQSVKPAFGELVDAKDPAFACHHLILPGSATTPEAGYYLASFMKVPKAKQTELAQKIESFCNSPVCTELSVKPIFSIIAPSREDAETLVGLTGYKCEAEARRYLDSTQHKALEALLDGLVAAVSHYGATLRRWTPEEEE